MNKMKILIKGKVNEAKRKVIHKLGGYTETEAEAEVIGNTTLQTPVHYVTLLDLKTLVCTQEISMNDLAVVPEIMFKREICRKLAENLMEFTSFSLCGPLNPDFCHYCMTGEIKVLRPELGGVLIYEDYRGPALRKDSEDAEVDRGGDPQP